MAGTEIKFRDPRSVFRPTVEKSAPTHLTPGTHEHTEEQQKFVAKVRRHAKNTTTPDKLRSTAANITVIDKWITHLRNIAVFTRIAANTAAAPGSPANDGENPNSFFDKLVYKDGIPGHLTPFGDALVASIGISYFISFAVEVNAQRRRERLASLDYLIQQIERDFDKKLTTEEQNSIRTRYTTLETNMLHAEAAARIAKVNEALRETAQAKEALIAKKLAAGMSQQAAEAALKKEALHQSRKASLKSAGRYLLGFPDKVWRFLGDLSIMFWFVYLPVSIAIGVGAAVAVPAMTVIIGITLALGLTYLIGKAILRPPTKKEQERKDLSDKIKDKVRQQVFNEWIHANRVTPKQAPSAETVVNRSAFLSSLSADKYMTHKITPVGDITTKSKAELEALQRAAKARDAAIEGSALGKYLLGKKKERGVRFFNGILGNFISYFVLAVFIFWFLSAALSLTIATLPVSIFLGGALFNIVASASSSALYTAYNTRKLYLGEKGRKASVVNNLLETVKNDQGVDTGITKLHYFEELQKRIAEKEKYLNGALTDDVQKRLKLHLDKIGKNQWDNYRHFEEMIDKHGKGMLAKKFLKRLYVFVYGTQTGTFLFRFLFLAGGIAAVTVAALGLLGFIGLAVGFSVFVGGRRLLDYHLSRRVGHRDKFDIDERTRYLDSRLDQLTRLEDWAKAGYATAKPPLRQPVAAHGGTIRHSAMSLRKGTGRSTDRAPLTSAPSAGTLYGTRTTARRRRSDVPPSTSRERKLSSGNT